MTQRRINQNRSEGLDGDVLERLLADVRGHMSKVELTWLARKADLKFATVARLAYGETMSPRLLTIMKVMVALGKQHPILEAFRSEAPLTAKQAAKRKQGRSRQKLKEEREKKIHPHRLRPSGRRRAERAAVFH